jgi:hypothetical protein
MLVRKNYTAQFKANATQVFQEIGKQICVQLDQYEVGDNNAEKVVDFTIYMLCKHPKMKVERIVKKTVHKFRLQKRTAQVVSMQ